MHRNLNINVYIRVGTAVDIIDDLLCVIRLRKSSDSSLTLYIQGKTPNSLYWEVSMNKLVNLPVLKIFIVFACRINELWRHVAKTREDSQAFWAH
jgi:hypothetical protein